MSTSAFQTFFTTKDLNQCTKCLNTIINKPEKESIPQTCDIDFQCYVLKEKFDCLAGLELNKRIVYAFAKNNEYGCEIQIHSFQKKGGKNKKLTINNINGFVTTLKFILFIDGSKLDGNQKHSNQCRFSLLMGFKDGFLKEISLQNTQIRGVRLDVKPITSIISGDYERFHKQTVCIVLAQDNHIYFVDLKKLEIVYIFRPNIIACDKALSIEINEQYSHLMQTTQGGYIIFWKMSKTLNHFKLLSQNGKKECQRQFNVFPIRVNHSIALDGLLSCFFYGNIIALISKSGILKLVVINIKVEEQFVILLEYKISDPQSITSACIYPQQDCIFISKSKGPSESYIEKLIISEELSIERRIKICIKGMDAINSFYLPPDSSIMMCRGENCYGIGFNTGLFTSQQYPRETNKTKMQVVKDY